MSASDHLATTAHQNDGQVGGGPRHPVVVAPEDSRFFHVPEGIRLVEPFEGSPGITFPRGFLAGGMAVGLKESGRPDMGVLAVDEPWRTTASSAALFTRNAFAAAPVVLNMTECDLDHLIAVVMNSGNANACTGPGGLEVARAMQTACADALGALPPAVAVGSTGIIGVPLDAAFMAAGVAKTAATIKPDGGPEFNRSILTTDRFAKICALELDVSGGVVRLGACAKGAGMISPALATMLCVVTTDAALTPQEMRSSLTRAVSCSFNRVTVDGEMSTNDSVFFLASGASGLHPRDGDLERFGRALDTILVRLALMMVADGEGATKVMRLTVQGAESEEDAVSVARSIGDSQLVKTAMHGGDPNWGRIISSAGAAMAGRSLPKATLQLCGVTVVSGGAAHRVSEHERSLLSFGMKQPEIDICLDLGMGMASTELYFADLGHEYITINAEYHS